MVSYCHSKPASIVPSFLSILIRRPAYPSPLPAKTTRESATYKSLARQRVLILFLAPLSSSLDSISCEEPLSTRSVLRDRADDRLSMVFLKVFPPGVRCPHRHFIMSSEKEIVRLLFFIGFITGATLFPPLSTLWNFDLPFTSGSESRPVLYDRGSSLADAQYL